MSEDEFLSNYESENYDRISVAVDLVTLCMKEDPVDNYRMLPELKLKVLMVKRKQYPEKGKYALVGGFLRQDELAYDCAKRKLKEKTNIEHAYIEQLYSFTNPVRDKRMRIVSIAHLAIINHAVDCEMSDGKWFNLKFVLEKENIKQGLKECECSLTLESEEEVIESKVKMVQRYQGQQLICEFEVMDSVLAFDHAKIISYAMLRLRNKVEYTPIPFYFLTEQFTIKNLQTVHELILDKELVDSNFRRKISDKIEETDEMGNKKGHRTAKLYRMKPEFE